MAQIDFITYSGQLVMTLVAFTTLLWFVGTVVRSNTHMYVGYWYNVPALTSSVSNEYSSSVYTRISLFSNIFGTLVSRMVENLSAFITTAVQTLSSYTYKGTWKSGVLGYIVKSVKLLVCVSNTILVAPELAERLRKNKSGKVIPVKKTPAKQEPVKSKVEQPKVALKVEKPKVVSKVEQPKVEPAKPTATKSKAKPKKAK